MVKRVRERVLSVAPGDTDGLSLEDFAVAVGRKPITVLDWIRFRGLRFRKSEGVYFLSRHDAELIASGRFYRAVRGVFHERP